jgi:hypothetical protein
MILSARENGAQGRGGPRLRDYSPTVERLDKVIDGLQGVTAAIVASAGGKPPRFHPQPRPETAFESVLHRRKMARHDALTRRLLRRQKAQEGDAP